MTPQPDGHLGDPGAPVAAGQAKKHLLKTKQNKTVKAVESVLGFFQKT